MAIDANAEILGLRTVLRDLMALSAIPAAWVGREPLAVAQGLADTLIGLLQLDFVAVRLGDPDGCEAVEASRGGRWETFPEWLKSYLGDSGRLSRAEIIPDVGGGIAPCRGIVIPIGFNADGGVVAAASDRTDFPTEIDQMLLRLAANQAATAFQNACLIEERTRAEEELRRFGNELEVKVAEQTAEQSALRRVATSVARGVPPEDVFAVVTEEVGRLLPVEYAGLGRYQPDGTITYVASWSRTGPRFRAGTEFMLGGRNLSTLVFQTAGPARIDDYADASGPLGVGAREGGVGSGVGAPVIVEGRLWGVMATNSPPGEPLPAHTESRLASFTELLATAIANAESRAELAQLAEEQAALQRVATLVAHRTPPDEVFAAVTEEVGRLLPVEFANMSRYEPDGTISLVATWDMTGGRFPVGTRLVLGGQNLGTLVFETGRPARIDSYDDASGPLGVALRELGLHSSVGTPITVEGRLWGMMAVGSTGERLLPDTDARLANFTELVATAIADAESRAAVAASRARIVSAADETRRQIERDLHDGVQQRLVSLALSQRAARAAVPPELPDLHAQLARVADGLAGAVEEVQELSRGIHPAILARGGLAPALKTLTLRSAVPVELEVDTEARLPEPVEVAAYYVVSEALTNTAKHADASSVQVAVHLREGALELSIRDDGVGGADPTHGSGLIGLADRVDAIGGTIEVVSPDGKGTTLFVKLPCAEA